MFRSKNPTLSVFDKPQTWDEFNRSGAGGALAAAPIARERPTTMTVQGAVTKSLILLGLCSASAVIAWSMLQPQGGPRAVSGTTISFLTSGGLIGFLLAVILRFKPTAAPFLAPIYAVAEGLFVGAVSALYASVGKFGGPTIVLQAGLLTFAILGILLLAYKLRLIVVTNTFWRAISVATGGVLFFFLACLVLNLAGMNIGYLWSWGWAGVGIGAFLVILSAMTLCLDFAFIEQGSQANLPRAYEWYAGFALLSSLVWLYVETLRLLALLNNRR